MTMLSVEESGYCREFAVMGAEEAESQLVTPPIFILLTVQLLWGGRGVISYLSFFGGRRGRELTCDTT